MSKNKILVALNQSELSLKILPSVEQLFSPGENELILYYVTKPPTASGFGEPDLSAGYTPRPGDATVMPTLHPIYESQQRDNIKAHVKSELASLTSRLRDAGYEVSVKVGFSNNPVDSITRYIKECDASLVAMSTQARVGVTRFFFRNIADSLSKKAQVPVLLTHPAKS
jgi:nucleotide-binding universal stress UspA family protein